MVALRTLEKFSVRLLEDLLVDEDRNVSIVQSGSIIIINQVVNLNTMNPTNEMIKLPIKTGEDYSVSLTLPLDVATDLSTDERKLSVSDEYKYKSCFGIRKIILHAINPAKSRHFVLECLSQLSGVPKSRLTETLLYTSMVLV